MGLAVWWRDRRKRILQLWGVGVVASLVVTGASSLGYLEALQSRSVDLLLFLQGQRFAGEVVLVAIDEEAFESVGRRQPLPRGYLAKVVRGVQRAGAAVVGLDLALSSPTEPAEDAELAQSIRGFADAGVSRVVLVQAPTPGAAPWPTPPSPTPRCTGRARSRSTMTA